MFYIFSLILFAFYRDPVWLDERYCRNIYECYVSIVHYGFVGGPYMVSLSVKMFGFRELFRKSASNQSYAVFNVVLHLC